jgi:hypothetical protein
LIDQGFIIIFDNEEYMVLGGLDHIVAHEVQELEIGLYYYLMDKSQFFICAME